VRRLGFWMLALAVTAAWAGITYLLHFYRGDNGMAMFMFAILGGLFVGTLWETLNEHGDL
jgi:hypothetical protein